MSQTLMPWLSEFGLFLDLIGFILLSIDLTSSLKGEREARDNLISLERKVFNARYGVFAPEQAELARQNEQFDNTIQQRIKSTDRNMASRRHLAYWAIGIATVGFVFQIIGGWPGL